MKNQSLSLVDVAKSRMITWTLLLTVMASGAGVCGEGMGRSADAAVQGIVKLERQSRTAIRYSIWLYRLYRLNAGRQRPSAPTKAS
jgi:hypothetical protein